jgi:hypothetical protein
MSRSASRHHQTGKTSLRYHSCRRRGGPTAPHIAQKVAHRHERIAEGETVGDRPPWFLSGSRADHAKEAASLCVPSIVRAEKRRAAHILPPRGGPTGSSPRADQQATPRVVDGVGWLCRRPPRRLAPRRFSCDRDTLPSRVAARDGFPSRAGPRAATRGARHLAAVGPANGGQRQAFRCARPWRLAALG